MLVKQEISTNIEFGLNKDYYISEEKVGSEGYQFQSWLIEVLSHFQFPYYHWIIQKDSIKAEEFKLLYKERYKIEAKHSELKNNHDMGKTHTSGLFGMQLQALVTIFTVNLKRIITLDEEKRQK